jgi:hypothetical protein
MKRLLISISVIVGISILIASCSVSNLRDYKYNNAYIAKPLTASNDGIQTPRMMIYDAEIKIEVKNIDSANVYLSELAKRFGGYVQRLGSDRSVIRVNAANLEAAIAEISHTGKIREKKIFGEDVTDEYTDYSIRMDNLIKARKRYLELLEKAENVEAALLVEKELERLNKEIDLMEGKLKNLEHNAEYSTITIYMYEKVKPGILGYIGIGLYYSVKWLFVRN